MADINSQGGLVMFPEVLEQFEKWWSQEGKFIAPDAADVSWFDKRKALAGTAFAVAMVQSGNYFADDAVTPCQIIFANGRTVSVVMDDDGNPILRIGSAPLDGTTERRT